VHKGTVVVGLGGSPVPEASETEVGGTGTRTGTRRRRRRPAAARARARRAPRRHNRRHTENSRPPFPSTVFFSTTNPMQLLCVPPPRSPPSSPHSPPPRAPRCAGPAAAALSGGHRLRLRRLLRPGPRRQGAVAGRAARRGRRPGVRRAALQRG
jgi:hypothetical protein